MTLDEQIAAIDTFISQIKATQDKNIDGRVLGTAQLPITTTIFSVGSFNCRSSPILT
jgi:hypothetical protein